MGPIPEHIRRPADVAPAFDVLETPRRDHGVPGRRVRIEDKLRDALIRRGGAT